MLRIPLKHCYSKSMQVGKQGQQLKVQRFQSSSSSSSGKSNVGLLIGGTAVLGVAGVVGYAKYDLAFRKQIEETIPYADRALDVVIGPKEPSVPTSKPSTPTKVSTLTQDSLLKKKLEREKAEAALKTKPKVTESTTTETKSGVTPLIPTIPSPELPSLGSLASNTATSNLLPGSEGNKSGSGDAKPNAATKSESGLPKNSELTDKVANVTDFLKDEAAKRQSEPKDPNAELREQLKIQLSAYHDYLKEQLQLQESELNRMNSIAMEERVLEEKMRYQRELASSIERLREVERILKVREKLDMEEESSRLLWLLCQRLNSSLKSNPINGTSSEPQLIVKNLKDTIDSLTSAESSDIDTVSKLALKSIPKQVLDHGVYSEDALIQRFDKVDDICKRVSLVNEENNSLMRYALSYLQSMLVIDRAAISGSELSNEEIDVTKLSTYDILARVRHFLRERNLEMSLRYANQLKGEPRKIASDWIRDVRNHLEVRQVSTIVQAQCSAVTLRTLNSTK